MINLSITLLFVYFSVYNGNDGDDVIPSSNPNSPDTFISDQKLPQTATPDIFSENCSKVDLTQYCTVLGIEIFYFPFAFQLKNCVCVLFSSPQLRLMGELIVYNTN